MSKEERPEGISRLLWCAQRNRTGGQFFSWQTMPEMAAYVERIEKDVDYWEFTAKKRQEEVDDLRRRCIPDHEHEWKNDYFNKTRCVVCYTIKEELDD